MTAQEFGDVSRFPAVDQESDPRAFIHFVDTLNSLPDVQAIKERMILRLRLRPGQRVLDVGCGAGDDARRLAQLVGPSGQAVGVDFSQAMVDEARARAAGSGLPVEFHQGNATALDLPDGAFDAARCERLLLHVPDAAAAVAEMVRVTRPGGRVVVFDGDFDTIVIDHPDLVLTRRLMTAICDKLTNGRIGRQLPRLLRDAGLVEVEAEGGCVTSAPFSFMSSMMWGTLGGSPEIIDPADLAAWLAPLEEADKAGRLFGGFTGFIVSGTRPR
jgi:ubiquinone/menaquinone biosynthesis C-methylase UbiE